MVGVRFRRALFPGYSDAVGFSVSCPSEVPFTEEADADGGSRERSIKGYIVPEAAEAGTYRVTAVLNYRKVDQFLLNYMFGEDSGLTAPVIELDRATAEVRVLPQRARTETSEPAGRVGG